MSLKVVDTACSLTSVLMELGCHYEVFFRVVFSAIGKERPAINQQDKSVNLINDKKETIEADRDRGVCLLNNRTDDGTRNRKD